MAQDLDIKGIERFLCGIPGLDTQLFARRHAGMSNAYLPLLKK
jgi:hypothetical protein